MENINQETKRFKDYFETADIVVLGENIGHGKNQEVVRAFLDQFHDQISTLFIEFTVDLQEDVEKYLKTGEMGDNLKRTFAGARKEGKMLEKQTLTELDTAKTYGIEVICFDASKTSTQEYGRRAKTGYYFIKGECRDEDMFENVKAYQETHPGKAVVVIGGHHLTSHNFEGNFKNFGPRMTESFGDRCIFLGLGERKDKEEYPLAVKFEDVI